MRTKRVKIGKDIYTLTAVTCDVSGSIAIELIGDCIPLVTALVDGDLPALNKEIRTSIEPEKLMRIFKELINVNVLEKNGDLVVDWKTEFECKPLTIFQLGYEALKFNCEDFFTFISGFVKESKIGENLNEVTKILKKDGVELPPILSFLLQNGEETNSETEPIKE